ncbi:hypothetical protein [Blastochloris viridis]|uniref:Uncharacterized protein n=1 Tax=Blastochloris viridis TaxID=1079 RepID=A0A0H5B7Z4_BLAVI|nr:hypothetical protein [Blastochloris viridis]ALK08425.1 hypothetical protein BVIR_630 [Blastochloris viridis]BAR98297.1 hypothetical protein BV133_704 [Blastochloris viridis]CUU41087.1 hypothetical protein BVIRIDIS_00740 [Blastochloris viridis]
MALLDLFRKKPKATGRAALTDWLDSRAAHLTQKGIHDYSRARAGTNWQQIYSEPIFLEALDIARWRSYPIGLRLVGELAEGALRPHAPAPAALPEAVAACALDAFDRHPVFPAIAAGEWASMRAELRASLVAAGLHPPKPVKDIAVPVGDTIFALMPMHPTIKQQDSLIVRNQLRTGLIALHEEFTATFDLEALAAALAPLS